MLSEKRIWAPILRPSQVRWDGLTKRQAGCPPTTNRIGFALPDHSDNVTEKDGKFHPLPRSRFRGPAGENREGLENFYTGRDRRDLAKTLSHLGTVEA